MIGALNQAEAEAGSRCLWWTFAQAFVQSSLNEQSIEAGSHMLW